MKRFFILPSLCLALALLPFRASAAANNDYFYSQLDAGAQEVYTHLLQNRDSLHSGTPVSISKSGMDHSSASRYMQSSANAVKALNRDHPEIFWLDDWRTEASGLGNDYVFTLNFNFADSWAAPYGSRSISDDENAMNSQIAALAGQARAAGSNRYDQLAFVHDWLTHNNLYNSYAAGLGSPVGDSTPWEAVSALDTSLSPVCEGYSRAFKLVCDALEIPCVLVTGGDHMWNCVQMEDGAWYAVDVTYDDPVYSYNGLPQNSLTSGGESRKYFLVGAQSFGDHTYDREWNYPALNPSDYAPGSAVQPAAPEIPVTPVTPAAPSSPSSWAQEEVGNAIQLGLVPVELQSGYQNNISRADFAHLAVVLVGQFTGSGADGLLAELDGQFILPFQDTSDPYVLAAYSLNIVNGRTRTTFDPNGTITRQEAAAMLARAASVLGVPVNSSAKNFRDSERFAPWAVDAIAYVSSVRTPDTNKPVMGGVGSRTFDPFGAYTREQAYITVFRLFQALNGGLEGLS